MNLTHCGYLNKLIIHFVSLQEDSPSELEDSDGDRTFNPQQAPGTQGDGDAQQVDVSVKCDRVSRVHKLVGLGLGLGFGFWFCV